MTTDYIKIKGQQYRLYTRYQHNEKMRSEFNRMVQKFWQFDFENYYLSGKWDDSCILYSLFDGDKIVSHTTVSLFTHKRKKLIQLGTVMTDEAYQRKGLSRFLMQRILNDFLGDHDGLFLFANETVLNFYPKFGFVPVEEAEHYFASDILHNIQKLKRQRLDLNKVEDLSLFERMVETAVPNCQFPTKNNGLSFFYCLAYPEMGFNESIYFIEELDCAVVAQIDHDIIYIVEIYAPTKINLKALVGAFSDIEFKEVVFGFTPIETAEMQHRTYKEDDLQLFVSKNLQYLFEENHLRVNSLSHT